jgi:hypothetical protein
MGLQDTCCTVCDDDTECVTGKWYGYSDGSLERFCKPYAGTDKDCEFYTMAAFYEKCDPDTHFCMDTMYCEIADGGGKCTEMGIFDRQAIRSARNPPPIGVTTGWANAKPNTSKELVAMPVSRPCVKMELSVQRNQHPRMPE